MRVSVVVPVYNSESTLTELVSQISTVVAEVSTEHEIVLVDDGSHDGSWATIVRLSDRFPQLVGIRLASNVGEHHAVLCGIRAARYGVAVTLDDDLQNPPSEIPALLREIAAGRDLVYGTPQHMRQSWPRRLAARTGKGIAAALVRSPAIRSVSSFRAFRTSLRDEFANGARQGMFLDEMLRWGATDVGFVPVRHAPRVVGRSNYRLGGLIDHTIDMITSSSVRPLRFASVLGAACLAAAVVLGAAGIAQRAGGHLASWLLAALVALVGGAVLLALGIVGEYLGRLFERSTGRPTYVVAAVHPPPGSSEPELVAESSDPGRDRRGDAVPPAGSEAL